MNNKPMNARGKRRKPWIAKSIAAAAILTALTVFALDDEMLIKPFEVDHPSIPEEFDGYKILHISDVHSFNGSKQSVILDAAKIQAPDLIVLTGDIVDESYGAVDNIRPFIRALTAIAPTAAVSGNHDSSRAVRRMYEEENVHALYNKGMELSRRGASIWLAGLADPPVWKNDSEYEGLTETLSTIPPTDGYNVLLFHRANLFDKLAGSGYQLVLSGHIHGGFVRLPFISAGLIGPQQDWLPKYTAGLYEKDGTSMIVSAGLGDPIDLPRVFNPYEILVITLRKS